MNADATSATELWSDIIPSVLRVPLAVHRHRKLIQKWWTHLSAKSGLLAKTDVVVTGRSAVGKTVLSSKLHGMASDINWELPGPSTDVETNVIPLGDWSDIVRVIPGQSSLQRAEGLHEAFNSHKSLRGVIHVVDWGYTPERQAVIVEKRIKEDKLISVDDWREHNLPIEVQEFSKVCEKIRESYARCGSPTWLIVAVNKADLFTKNLDCAQKYYHPQGNSDFSQNVQKLLSDIGNLSFKVKIVPVSSWDRDFSWNGEIVKSNIGGTDASRALFRNFVRSVAEIDS